ncbi:leucine-rich repeat domain-containing protein [Gammaproteobacteria bacterium]|nr:leucine-rich repeat domain-containing protein [Gammaproteobacteria bacterium]
MKFSIKVSLLSVAALLTACSSPLVVTINQQAVYDPGGRIVVGEVADADLQGCINLALQQQGKETPSEITVLSCANAEINTLDNIQGLSGLRFLDLGNNNLSNITPLEELIAIGGVNLANNRITDIGPLFNMPSLTSVNLSGNLGIACEELDELQRKLGSNLILPGSCKD